jgi:hypothetical protein
MCNCGKRAAEARAARAQAPPQPIQPRVGVRALPPEPVIHDPAVWGPHLWTALHTLAEFIHGPHVVKQWSQLLSALRTSLPCPECTHHYVHWYAGHPLVRRSGVMLMTRAKTVDIREWLLALHNDVNGRKGVGAWTLEAVTATYGRWDDRVQRVRGAIDAIRGMVGGPAIQALDVVTGLL